MSQEQRQPKTEKELEELKKDVEALNKKLEELSEEELKKVSAAGFFPIWTEFP